MKVFGYMTVESLWRELNMQAMTSAPSCMVEGGAKFRKTVEWLLSRATHVAVLSGNPSEKCIGEGVNEIIQKVKIQQS